MIITYEQIKKANDSIRTTDIKGKDYAEVNQRIKAFRMVYPTGQILTDMISNENGVCVFKATVSYLDEEVGIIILGTGTAYEKENSTFINKTSYIENCETSAVGRALGMAGFGIDTSVASFEEVSNAIINQEETKAEPKATAKQVSMIESLCNEEEIYGILKWANVGSLTDLTVSQASLMISKKKVVNK